MRHARHVISIGETTDIDAQTGAGFIGFSIVDEQCLQFIGKANDSVRSVIKIRFFELVRDVVNSSHYLSVFCCEGEARHIRERL